VLELYTVHCTDNIEITVNQIYLLNRISVTWCSSCWNQNQTHNMPFVCTRESKTVSWLPRDSVFMDLTVLNKSTVNAIYLVVVVVICWSTACVHCKDFCHVRTQNYYYYYYY